jgi:hypothetical protein
VDTTPKQKGLDVLILTHVGTMHHVERDMGAVAWAVIWVVEALPMYGAEMVVLAQELMVVLGLVVMALRCKGHPNLLRSKGIELVMNLAIGVELLSIGTRIAMQATE